MGRYMELKKHYYTVNATLKALHKIVELEIRVKNKQKYRSCPVIPWKTNYIEKYCGKYIDSIYKNCYIKITYLGKFQTIRSN